MDEIQQAVQNATETVSATPKRIATPEGMALAYVSLMVMAVIPVILGSLRSANQTQSRQQENLSNKDAALFPFIASGVLVLLYLIFKFVPKEFFDYAITGYFYFLGVLAVCHLLSPIMLKLVPGSIPKVSYILKFTKVEENSRMDYLDYEFTSHDVICLVICGLIGLWYLFKKHWIINNLFGLAFAISGVEMLCLNNVVTGCILLGGLFVYDIFWVFYTDVMVTVAKSFEAPIKLVFPQDILENGWSADNFAMLGLGDIVIPGIFIALLLRFDKSLKRKHNIYFYSSVFAYVLGLGLTIIVMHMFKHAQPALLYLVPSCLGISLLLALIKGDLTEMFNFNDEPSTADDESSDSASGSSGAESNSTLTPTKTKLRSVSTKDKKK